MNDRRQFVLAGLILTVQLAWSTSADAQRQFGFDNRKPSGQPYWDARKTVRQFKVAPGYRAELVAAEPDVINPIAFTIDERGRLWVLENFEYPKRTPRGQKPRDRIKILEDSNGDGRFDKVTVWASGQTLPIGWELASGLEVGDGGVYLGAPPYLFFLQDTDKDGKADKQTILLKGFGSHDTHETLNTFQWGPDSKLYGLHGVFTHSNVGGVRLNAAVWRYDTRAKKFEVFAEGTSNPWGMDFDQFGRCHLVCCVIPHLFHMVPGGTYIRQAGTSFNPYAYGLLPQSCDHTHHRESGWAHAGLLVMQGDHVPEPYRDSLIMGSIHGCSIKRDVLRPSGSTYLAGHAPDFVVSGDKNFRPINLRWGPDGSIYIIDWHDQNPCHQAPPDSWDKKRGRIYRLVPTSRRKTVPKRLNLSLRNSADLVALLAEDNPWWYRTAIRVLRERQDRSVLPFLRRRVLQSKATTLALRSLWATFALGGFDDALAKQLLGHSDKWRRMWAVRLLGEQESWSEATLELLTHVMRNEPAPEVRLQAAASAQRMTKANILPLLHSLMLRDEDATDRFIPLMLWLAYEKCLLGSLGDELTWLRRHAERPLVREAILPRVMRRLGATREQRYLDQAIGFVALLATDDCRRRALQGLLQGLGNAKMQPPRAWRSTFPILVQSGNAEVRRLARKLAIVFRDPRSVAVALSIAGDAKRDVSARVDAVGDLAVAQPKEAASLLLQITADKREPIALREAACRALANFDRPDLASRLVSAWPNAPLPVRSAIIDVLTGRKEWARVLLAAVEKKVISPTAINNNHVLKMQALRDQQIRERLEKVWGKLRETPAELAKLVARMRRSLYEHGGSAERGRKVFEANCAKCHRYRGRGHKVGPELDGASREIEYLLTNVLDPNRVVGQPYFTRLVLLKNGRVETGLLVSEDPNSITLKGENDVVKRINRGDIDGKVVVQTKSVMPEGLTKNMSEQDFRDLVRYLIANPFVDEVAIAGPMGRGLVPAVDPGRPFHSKAVKWRRVRVPVAGRITLPGAGRRGYAFVAVVVESPESITTTLKIGCTHPVEAWLNGRKVLSDPMTGGLDQPDRTQIPVTLRRGPNTLVVRVAYSGQARLYLRFHDPDHLLKYRSSSE